MADTVLNIAVGAAVVSLATYVAPAAGAEPTGHTFTDVGAVIGGTSMDPKFAWHDLMSDHHLGVLDSVKTMESCELKIRIEEANPGNLALALNSPTGNVTGTPPNLTYVNKPNDPRVLLACKFVTVGTGTTRVRTISFWRCIVKDVSSIGFKKDGEQIYELTVQVCQEILVTTGAQTFKQVDS